MMKPYAPSNELYDMTLIFWRKTSNGDTPCSFLSWKEALILYIVRRCTCKK